jgi:hypothetical protein
LIITWPETQNVSVVVLIWLMIFGKIIAVYSEEPLKLRFSLRSKRVTHVKGSQKISLHGTNLLVYGCQWFPALQQNLAGNRDTDDHKVETVLT